MAENQIPPEEGPRSFARFVEAVADGELASELSEELFELVRYLEGEATARQSTSSGLLTLKLKITVDDRGYARVTHDVATKRPKTRRTEALMYVTKGGNLVRENPRQQSLPLRDVSKRPEVRDLATGKEG